MSWAACIALFSLLGVGETLNINPGFESGVAPVAEGWASDDDDGARWTPTEETARSGKRSIKLPCVSSPKSVPIRLVSQPMNCRTGDAIEFMAWTRSHGTPRNQLRIYLEGQERGQWRLMEPAVSRPQSDRWLNSEWTPRCGMVFAPKGIAQFRMVAEASIDSEIRSAWYVDDFTCTIQSFGAYSEANQGREQLPNLYLAAPDTMAQNALGCYGETRVPTPNIDRLAAEGRLYTNMVAAAPWTKPSFASILTGMYPSQHTVEGMYNALPDSLVTLPERLKERGYFTAAFVFSPYDGFLGPYMQFNQGFDVFFFSDDEALVTQMLLRFLETNRDALASMNGGGFFIWHHLFEPHTPYINRHPVMLNNPEGKLGPVNITDIVSQRLIWTEPGYGNDADRNYMHDVYKWEVNHADGLIGQVLARMQWAGLLDSLNIVFTADHGEAFGETQWAWGHGNPYEACVKVPLILRFPGKVEPGTRNTTELTGHLDLMPTVLELAGAALPSPMEGRSLLQQATSQAQPRYSACEGRDFKCLAITDGRHKLNVYDASQPAQSNDPNVLQANVWSLDKARYELYDLTQDPWERNDITAQQPEILARLKEALNAHCARTGLGRISSSATAETRAISEETAQALGALGYFGGDNPVEAVEKRGEQGLGNMEGF